MGTLSGYPFSTHRARLDHVLGFSACCSVAHALRMASGLLLGLLVGGPGLFPTYFASARATCTPPTAFVSSALRLVKGYKLPPAALEEKVTFTILPETSHVPEVVHRASGSGVRSSSFVDRCVLCANNNPIRGNVSLTIALTKEDKRPRG